MIWGVFLLFIAVLLAIGRFALAATLDGPPPRRFYSDPSRDADMVGQIRSNRAVPRPSLRVVQLDEARKKPGRRIL